eukprot:5591067-Prorocentrum_lima.AAC.1
MTSSLVGSEMCIRDRLPRSGQAQGTLKLAGGAPLAPLGRLSLSCRQTAVSYTHLTLPTICSV